jgi:hypothetical protein
MEDSFEPYVTLTNLVQVYVREKDGIDLLIGSYLQSPRQRTYTASYKHKHSSLHCMHHWLVKSEGSSCPGPHVVTLIHRK